mgnify:CR=1 FL=1
MKNSQKNLLIFLLKNAIDLEFERLTLSKGAMLSVLIKLWLQP